ncbi:MAG: MGH1-like glycoside hydrolase domain-containing protein [Limisphaerales bacterium]
MLFASLALTVPAAQPLVLHSDSFAHYVDTFNRDDDQGTVSFVDNQSAWPWLRDNIPWFECPDKELEEIYYFRWWTYRKHIVKTPAGFVITEFLPPVPWAGKYNTIPCAAGHHLYEGRWLHDPKCLDDYARFWFRGGGEPRRYSFWAADALYAQYLVRRDRDLVVDLLPDLVANYAAWEKARLDASGLFWQNDGEDGMEVSIGGSGLRPTINSYLFGDAMAIANIAELAGKAGLAETFRAKAARLKALVQTRLWDDRAKFFKVLPRGEGRHLADVRELLGYVPWYFNLPDRGYEIAWRQLMDPQGFFAPYGPTTAERRHPRFRFPHEHECLWNGPSWPYATTQTLVALANVLNGYDGRGVTKADYLQLVKIYAHSQHLTRADGTRVPWIDENLDPDTGAWIARDILIKRRQPPKDRGKDYNHSAFCDLIITGLVGLRPRADNVVELNPLVPADTWDYFCLDDVAYHGHRLTILYDRTGQHYHRGRGLRVFADGRQIARAAGIERVTGQLPAVTGAPADIDTHGGWRKYEHNPVLGGALGTCFDVALLRERGRYRMWFSWRPKKSLALVESPDGIHWSEPVIVLGPNPSTKWEDDINRPVVVQRADGYHLWYTGQANGRSSIGYATSSDGVRWTRRSSAPVVSPDQPWEKVAVMCPHVLWDAKQKRFRMWYSGGDQYEPDAIGYATSADGLRWAKRPNPIFQADPRTAWEQHKVTACQVIRRGGWHYMFYIGFRDVNHAQIGLARSRDGITGWERFRANPILSPGENQWDHDACYKPFAIFDGRKWLLWYNGRRGGVEQIGLAIHDGEDLGWRRD